MEKECSRSPAALFSPGVKTNTVGSVQSEDRTSDRHAKKEKAPVPSRASKTLDLAKSLCSPYCRIRAQFFKSLSVPNHINGCETSNIKARELLPRRRQEKELIST